MKEIGVLDDRDYHREEISLGEGDSREGFTNETVDRVVEAIEAGLDPDDAWDKHGEEVWH
ncbi:MULTISPECIES: hypothetical protein [Halolamina]|uniref:hypothetical protein n=1 Tax=Halolamina TaxID=1075397 RepID=UPI0011609E03|nr:MULTISPECIES: hypothetical protein [Halolamina]NHX37299.1 hypothetical protein [Halolamina sp. R1-12]